MPDHELVYAPTLRLRGTVFGLGTRLGLRDRQDEVALARVACAASGAAFFALYRNEGMRPETIAALADAPEYPLLAEAIGLRGPAIAAAMITAMRIAPRAPWIAIERCYVEIISESRRARTGSRPAHDRAGRRRGTARRAGNGGTRARPTR